MCVYIYIRAVEALPFARIETRALDDFRVIERVHSFSNRFFDRRLFFLFHAREMIINEGGGKMIARTIAQNERIYIYTCIRVYVHAYFTENR